MEFLPPSASIEKIILEGQDLARFQQLLKATFSPGAIMKARVIGLLGDKAILSIQGEKIFAKASTVPLVAGELLDVQVKEDGDTLQLKVIATSKPDSSPAQAGTLSSLLEAAGIAESAKAEDLYRFLASLNLSPDAETMRQAVPLLSEKPTSEELRSVALLKLSDLPVTPDLFESLKSFFESQVGQEIPFPRVLSEEPPIPLVQGKNLDLQTVIEPLKQMMRTLLQSPEATLLTLSSSLKDLETVLQKIPGLPKELIQKETPSLTPLVETIKAALKPDDPVAALLQKLETLLQGETPETVQHAPPRDAGAAEQTIPAAKQASETAQQLPAPPPQAQTSVPDPSASLEPLRNALQHLVDNLSLLRNDPLVKMQNAISTLPPSVQNAVSRAISVMEDHQLGNALLARQDQAPLSIPIPLTVNGKNWVGYLHISSEQNRKKLEQNLKDGTFTVHFSVQTRNMGTVGARVSVRENILSGTFQVKGGEEKKFIEQNTDKLLKRLESLPFKVHSIEARIGEDAMKGTGWSPARVAGTLDIRV